MHTCLIICVALQPCTSLWSAFALNKMDAEVVQHVLCFCLVFYKVWLATIHPSCWFCSSVFISPDSTCLLPLLPHRFKNLMNCTNLRLTSNPIFLSLRSKTITGGESCTDTFGTWESNVRTHSHIPTHTEGSEAVHWQINLLNLEFHRFR